MAIAKLSIDIEAKLANFEQQLEKVAKASEGMAGRVKSSFSALGSTIGVAVGALAAAGAIGQFKEFVNYLDQFDEAAERIGTSAQNLSELAYAAKLSGVEFEDLNKGLVKFSSTLADAASGNKDAIELLNRLGVSAENYGNLDKALDQTANSFAKFENGVAKTALASDAFGEKLGSKMVPLLSRGAAGMAELRAEAQILGGVIDDKLAKQAADFNDNLDKLSAYASTAGKSLAGGLLPWLNEVAESFLISRKNAESFWEAVNRPLPGTGFIDVEANLAKVLREYEQIDFRLSNGRAREGDQDKFDKLGRELKYWQDIKAAREKADGPASNKSAGTVSVPGKAQKTGKPDKVASPEATAEAKAYADAMESLAKSIQTADMAMLDLSGSQKQLYDLMTSQAWASMPDTWKQTAVAQFEQAYAAEQAAAATAQLNRLLGATESSKIEEARDDMLALVEALEQGVISEEKYLEAVAARLGKGTQEIEKQKSLAEELGLTFTSAFEDAIAGGKGFSDVLKGLESDILRLLTRMAVTEPLGNAVKGFDWGSLAKSVVGAFGGTATANAKGNVYSMPSLSAYSGSIVSQPTFFANGGNVMGEAGPEGIFPLKRGADGKLGVVAHGAGGGDVTVNVINNTDAQARTERRTDGRGNSIIDVVIERTKAAIASDIGSGSGAVPAALQSTYGIKRTAGAY